VSNQEPVTLVSAPKLRVGALLYYADFFTDVRKLFDLGFRLMPSFPLGGMREASSGGSTKAARRQISELVSKPGAGSREICIGRAETLADLSGREPVMVFGRGGILMICQKLLEGSLLFWRARDD
jgi:hypothetical protein